MSNPELQWQKGKSAYETAHSWEKDPNKFPNEISIVLKKSEYNVFNKAKLLIAFPEYKVKLDTSRAPSQNDVFALALSDNELISITVEGKSGEDFDKTIGNWLRAHQRTSPVTLTSVKGSSSRPHWFPFAAIRVTGHIWSKWTLFNHKSCTSELVARVRAVCGECARNSAL